MKDYDKLIARLTDRLGVDPELQMDVAQELRGHLEDSAAEFHEAGLTDEQSETEAVKALGDPDELSGQLWSANRNRLRIRGVLRWAARLTLIPAAIGVIVYLIFSMGIGFSLAPLEVPESWANDLTEEQMYILRGDHAAKTPLERAKSITDRWPDNPVYFGEYLIYAVSQENLDTPIDSLNIPRKCRPRKNRSKDQLLKDQLVADQINGAKLTRWLELLTKGEKLNPDNAFYNFTMAAALIKFACEVEEDKSLTYPLVNRDGAIEQKPCYTVTIQNKNLFQQGLEQLRRGLRKPRFILPTVEMSKIRDTIIPEPRGVTDILRRTGMEISVILPAIHDYRILARSILGFALAEARKGNTENSLLLVRDVEQFANHLGANSSSLIELMVARRMYETTMGNSGQICKVLGMDKQWQQFQARSDESRAFVTELRDRGRHGNEKAIRSAGMLWGIFMPRFPGHTLNFEPMRTAEQFWANEFGLLLLLIILTLLTLLMGGVTLIELLCHHKPVLMFVGWGRIGKICLWAIVIPIGIYAAYVRFVTVGPDAFGMNFTAGRVILEMIFVGAVICVLLVGMSYAAIRHRADELGLAVPEPLTLRRRWIMWPLVGLLTLGVLIYLIAWWTGHVQPNNRSGWSPFFGGLIEHRSHFPSLEAVIIGVLILLFLPVWGLREIIGLLNRRYSQFRRSVYRNIVPILSAAVIVVGIICGIVLNRAESAAARRVTGDAILSFKAEIDRSDYSQLRDRFAARKTKTDAGNAGSSDRK